MTALIQLKMKLSSVIVCFQRKRYGFYSFDEEC